ncbi:DUF397 domain-containing protein [Solihabitans fulvus]|uniref:DUF397 domain-containing protein n=1 Tax=Solihabitans fulvus TaxID=1892852 RepID=A0A5B2WWZ5_9PSEU|nr:DUF397 domain-containing protein [Solihabitans fulvus]KAA2256533.1 DUF397 domain-containing protein [Solihabitans fulvus]
MTTTDTGVTTWRKSSRSGPVEQGNCVEVAFGPRRVAVRDSKNASGPTLDFTPADWLAFLSGASK